MTQCFVSGIICISLTLLVGLSGFIEGAMKSIQAVIGKEESRSDPRKVYETFAGASIYFSNMLSDLQY